MREVVEGSRRGELLAHLRQDGIDRIAPGSTDALQTAIAGVQMRHHLAVISVLGEFEANVPVLSRAHGCIVAVRHRGHQSRTDRSRATTRGPRR